jgi:L-2-hydroxyglutarate oxidase LhgO
MQAVTADALNEGVKLDCGVRYLGRRSRGVQTSAGSYHPGYVVNAAGLYADRIARDFGFSERYRILPFKGLYVSSADPGETVRTNIYPVPDLRMPFLGVHVTRTPAGITKIGPTAVPALWREQYAAFANFRLSEFVDVTLRQLYMVAFGGPIFRRLAVEELRKYSRRSLVALASSLMNGVRPERYRTWCTAGIRAQLVDTRRGTLEMDFVLEADDHSMHVLNAVSPGFTCALPFAEDVCRAIGAALGRRAGTGSAGIALAEAAR